MILNEIFRVVSRFPRYISCHIAESRDSAFHFEAKRTRRWTKRHSEKRLISTFFRGVSKKSKNYWFLYTVLYSKCQGTLSQSKFVRQSLYKQVWSKNCHFKSVSGYARILSWSRIYCKTSLGSGSRVPINQEAI